MPNKVEVITLSSSDEDSNPQVENTRNIAKQQKSTARKSLHSTTTIRNTTIKDEPPPPPTTTTKVKLASVNNGQFNSATSSGHQQQNAPKTLPKYNSLVHKVVSTPTTSPNPATITSQSRTVTVSTKQSISNSVTNTASKMPGITITPLAPSSKVVEKNKVLPTSQTNYDPKGIGKVNLNKHFKPSSTSTPKISNSLNSVNANTIKTLSESNKHINAKAPIISSVYSLGVCPSKAINEAQSSSSTGKIAKILPAVSISPSANLSNSEIPKTLLASLGKTGVTITKNSVNRKIHESLNTSTHKQNEKRNLGDVGMAKEKPSNSLPVFPIGVTVEKITVNKQILEATKEKVSNKFVPADKTGITVAKTAGTVLETPTTSTEKYKQKANVVASATTKEKFLNSFVPVNNRLFEGSKTATNSITDKNILSKQASKEFSGISNMAAKSGTTMTPVGQVNKQTKPQIYTNIVHTTVIPANIPTTNRKLVVKLDSVNKMKQETIFGSQTASTEVKDNNSKLSNNELSRELINFLPEPKIIPKEDLPKSSSDSIESKKSNKAVTILPVSKVATSSRNVNSQNNKGAPKKRTLTESDSRNDGTSKKAKLDPNSRLNGAHSNLATAEENMKRISALKKSLKVIAEGLTKSTSAGKNSKESSNSGTKGLVDNNKTGQLANDLGSESSKLFNESLPNKNINAEEAKSEQNKNSMKKDQNEKPLKQISPNTIKEKCQNFLTTVIRLVGEASKTGLDIEKLIQRLIDGSIEPEEFCAELKNEHRRPKLLIFLKESLPQVRQALLSGEMTIKGIRPPPLPASVQSTAASVQSTAPAKQISPNTIKEKCQNFLTTVIRLVGEASKTRSFHKLIQRLIESLPQVRQALLSGEMTIKGIRPPPLPASVQSTAASVQSTAPAKQESLPQVRQALLSGEMTIKGIRPPPLPASVQSTAASVQSTAPAKQISPNTIKEKCQNFLTTVIRLVGEASKTGLDIEKLIQRLIDGSIEPEEFCAELKNEHRLPKLLIFLKESLPQVRQALLSGEMTIKGIRPPPLPASVQSTAASVQSTAASVQSTAPAKQVTSPKLSLKRKQVINRASASQIISSTPIPLKYFPIEPSAKKAKLDSKGTSNVPITMGWKNEENPKESSIEPNQEVSKNSENVKAPPQNSVSLHITSQNDTSGNVALWDKSDDNATKFNKLLEFSKSFMTATPTEKCTIVKKFHRLLKKANSSYVDSSEFSSLLESTLQKIKDSKETFIQLQKVKTELKAYKRSKNATTPSRHRLLSSSSEQSEAVASNLEIPSDESPKKVPTPNLADKVASAMLPNFMQKETSQSVENNAADAFINVPCSSKQADIIESLHFSMPVSNGVKLLSGFRTKVSDTQRTSVGKPSISIRVTNKAFSGNKFDEMADPVPLLPASDPEIEVVNEVVTAAQKKSLIKGLNLQSIDQQNVRLVKIKSIQGELQANNLPPIPVKESVAQPKTSTETTDLDDMTSKPNDPSDKVSIIIDQSKLETNILPPMSVPEVDQPETSIETTHPVMNNVNESRQEAKSLPSTSIKKGGDQPEFLMTKMNKRVKFLETLLGKLDKQIKKLQAKELSMDDLDDTESTYILEDKYKRKFQKTWAKLCELKKRPALVGREIEKRFHYQGCRHSDFNKAIERLVNKRKPAEKFPNYVEVHNILKKVNERAHLSLSSYEIERAAREAFADIGKELKRRRQADEDLDFGCYLTDDISLETDPAEQDEELKTKLTNSVLEGEKKIAEIIKKYAAQEDPNAETGEGSNCEEEGVDDEMDIDMPPTIRIEKVVSVQHVDSVAEESLEDPVGIEVTAKSFENTDLPDTDPATPETDEREDNATPIPISVSRPATDVIDIDSSSSASTDPGPNATERSSSNFVMYRGSRVIMPDMRDFNDEPPLNYDDSSPDLPPLSELLKM
ncbi:hypothetical protein JTE90_018122 [Oedothorax gibbosus]|uniref:TAFH domain-containing protein n=1 Tax=Oedothorax gibbosus TaxID=931172 RepID=A0AAV6UZ17_9ARAC|nr:hypothetical protein JTE90_018122 [Oedothorax gibbosus]